MARLVFGAVVLLVAGISILSAMATMGFAGFLAGFIFLNTTTAGVIVGVVFAIVTLLFCIGCWKVGDELTGKVLKKLDE